MVKVKLGELFFLFFGGSEIRRVCCLASVSKTLRLDAEKTYPINIVLQATGHLIPFTLIRSILKKYIIILQKTFDP